MIKQEEIKKLIQSGFDLELISFELEIPIQQLIEYKKSLESSSCNTDGKSTHKNNKKNETYLRLKSLKERYKQIYLKDNNEGQEKREPLSEKELEKIDASIVTIEEKILSMKNLSRREKRPIANEILAELRKIEKYQLPLAQAERLYKLMQFEELSGLNIDIADRMDFMMGRQKSKSESQFIKALDYEVSGSNNLERLQQLDKMITLKMVSATPMMSTIRSKIASKINTIKQKIISEKMRNDISPRLEAVVIDLINGNPDLENAREIIDREAILRVQSKAKDKFSLTEEQEKRQILIQIRAVISDRADKYPVRFPEKLVTQLKELCGGRSEEALGTVVKNMIARNEYSAAKSLCDKFTEKIDYRKYDYKESEYSKYLRNLRNEIRNAEIGNLVLKAIKTDGTVEEEISCFELIEKGLQQGKVPLRAINLGKSLDGLRKITLADIWPNKVVENEAR